MTAMTPTDYKTHRLRADLTQKQLADRLGVSRVTINRREKGHDRISEEAALAASAFSTLPGSGMTDTQRLNWLQSNKTVRVEWWEDAQFRDYCMVLFFSDTEGMKEVNDHFQHYDLREAIDYAIEQISLHNNKSTNAEGNGETL